MKKICFIYFSLALLLFTSAFGQNKSLIDTTANSIIIKLVTIGPGHDLTSWWGHTAIIVEDNSKLQSKFYNYGLFSFEDDNFIQNFIMGRLIFWVGAWKTQNALVYYKGLDRDIRFQNLNLSKNESIEIKNFLENNVKPENARYLYDHYYDNCSTRLRDIFNNISKDALRKMTTQVSNMTLREHTRRHTYQNPVMDFILMFLMNDSIDKPIRVWDDMFLPSELEKVMDQLEYDTNDGSKKKIVKNKFIYYESKTVEPLPERAPVHWPYILILSVVLGLICIWLVYMENYKLFFVFNLLMGLILGFMGSLLFFLATFTNHTVTYYNENLFIANPFTFLIFFLSILELKNRDKYFKIFFISLTIILGIALVGLIFKLFPAFDQHNEQAIAFILPLLIGSFISSYIIKKRDFS